ncbi:hypothetical protein STANM309S_04831 [Streptomyces tanashiensis]
MSFAYASRGWIALAVKSGSPCFAASSGELRLVAEPCQIRGRPAYGRGTVVTFFSGGRNSPSQSTPSSVQRRRSSSYFSFWRSHCRSSSRPKRSK